MQRLDSEQLGTSLIITSKETQISLNSLQPDYTYLLLDSSIGRVLQPKEQASAECNWEKIEISQTWPGCRSSAVELFLKKKYFKFNQIFLLRKKT